MAVTSTRRGSIVPSLYNYVASSYTGPLKDFRYTVTGLRPDTRYFVGYSFDASNSGLSGMTGSGTEFGITYTAGSGSFRKTNGTGTVVAASNGILAFEGMSTSTANVRGALRLFYVPIAS